MADPKASKLRPPSKIGRPCCTVPPKPALPPSPPRSTMNSMEPLWESHGRRLSEAGLRRGSDTSVVLTEDTDSFIIGDRVWVGGTKPGSIAYIGETQFAPGDWAGVVLDDAIGKNDGSVAGSRYFQCEPKRGIFSRLTRLTRQPLPEAMSPTDEKTPTSPPDNSRRNFDKSISPSLNASTTSLASVSQKDYKIGDRVIVSSSQGSKTGVLRFVGTTEFAAGEWCGIELDDPVGKNDGSVGDIRYFECRPRFGLFAPSHKVSRSPLSRRTSTMCVVHKPTGASMNSSIRRIGGSRESLASMSSMASTNASIATRGTTSGSRRPGLRTSTPARSSMQEILKEKQQEIEMLRKERDFERQRISKAANQADNAEQHVITLKQEYDKYREEMENKVLEAQEALAQLLEDRNALKAHLEEERQKSEDLLFRFEEESVNKDDIQNLSDNQSVINALNESKMKELERQLTEERERVIQLEQDSTKLFEAEEELAKIRTEMSTALSHEKQELQDTRNRNLCLEEAKITLEKQILERNDLIGQYAEQIKDFEAKLKKHEDETSAQKGLESHLQKSTDDMKQNLAEKSNLIEIMKKEHEINADTLRREIEQLKEIIENLTKESAKEKQSMVEEHRRTIEEKENAIKSRNGELLEEKKNIEELHKSAIERLRAESAEHINKLSEDFKNQLISRDLQISQIMKELEEKSAEIMRLVEELSAQRSACDSKDEDLKKLMDRVEELSEQLKSSEDANVELKNQMDGLKTQSQESYSSFVQEKQKLEESVASLLASSTDSTDQIEKLNRDLQSKEKELSDLRDAKAAEIEELKKNFQIQIEDKTKYISEISADISEKSIRLNALEAEIEHLKAIIATKDEEIKNLSVKMSELQDAITLSEQTKTNLESELKMYDANIAELNKKMSIAEERSAQLTEQKTKLEAEIANVISTSANSSDQLVKYNEDLRLKEKELDELRESSFQLKNSLASVESKVTSTTEELNKANNIAEQYRTESEELKNKITEEIKLKNEYNLEIANLKVKEESFLKTVEENEKINDELKRKIVEVTELTEKLRETKEYEMTLIDKYSCLQNEFCEKEKLLESVSVELREKIALVRDESDKSQSLAVELAAQRVEAEKLMGELTKNVNHEIEEKKKLESTILEKNSHMEKLEAELAIVRKKQNEADEAASSLNVKYHETLKQFEILQSTKVNDETENSAELGRLRDKLVLAETENKDLINRLKNSERLTKELTEKIEEFTNVLKTRETEALRITAGLKEAESSAKMTEEMLERREKEFKETLEKRCSVNNELQERIDSYETELRGMKNELSDKCKLIEEMNGKSATMKEQLEVLGNLSKSKEEQAESITQLVNEVRGENKGLHEKIVALDAERNSRDITIEEMKREIEKLRDSQINMTKNNDQKTLNLLNAKQIEIDGLENENKNIRIAKESLEKDLRMEREKNESLSSLVNGMETLATNNTQVLEEELILMKKEAVVLKENQSCLEKENKQIIGKLNQALEDLKTFQENKKNNHDNENYSTSQKIQSTEGDMNQNSDRESEVMKLTDDNETYKGQIDFLNSVIVDMQRKNETLQCKIEVLEMGVPANEADDYSRSTLDKRMAAPRMFCDICDQFDLHETEDCPRQAQDFEEHDIPKKSPKKPSVERPYCTNCEMFGHDTLNCDEAETF